MTVASEEVGDVVVQGLLHQVPQRCYLRLFTRKEVRLGVVSTNVAGTGGDVGRLLLQPKHQLLELLIECVASVVLPNHEDGREVSCDNRILDTRTLQSVV
jgi:hypothetical protein